ncbi:MAG TPA: hypothetical protein VFA69_04950 [Candidatus Nitrosotalea sp.]|nr:hypothetical protein [Candidatus Nitrosotalea sp.]
MDEFESVSGTQRMTLRIPNSITNILKKEADKRDLPLNALITKILFKNVSYDMQVNTLPAVTVSDVLFSRIIDKLDVHDLEEIAKEGPDIIKKIFAIQGIEYTLKEVMDKHFVIMGKYCGWYSFNNTGSGENHRLVFETQLGTKWIDFLMLYVTNILESLKIKINSKLVHENVAIFKFTT